MSLLEMQGISKSFDGNQVLKRVDFAVEAGEIHALLGENGAGKSTLLNILAGVHHADEGRIRFDDKSYPNPSIRQMEKAGIAFVHQELNVVNDLTVSENLFFNRELTGPLGILKQKKMLSQTQALFEDLGVEINPSLKVTELKTSQKQLLEICRALHTNASLMILDEPTTALGNDEIEHLFSILRKLKAAGRSFIFVSHKMPEIFQISDSYTVLRNGEMIYTGKTAAATGHSITSYMVGEQFVDRKMYAQRPLGEVILRLENFCGTSFNDVNLSVREGEIVALTGLAGSGASELMQTMFGALRATSGEIWVKGKPVRGGIAKFMKQHIGMLPTNRKENSVIPDLSVLENQYLSEHCLSSRSQPISKNKELLKYQELKAMLGIKAQSPHDAITSLSGGNQQKVFFARWLNINADILLLDNPTQGVDVAAKEEIYALILELAKSGKTILINTLEIPEIMKVSDRCVVLYAGEVVKIFDHDDINEHDVMLYSTNAVNVEAGK